MLHNARDGRYLPDKRVMFKIKHARTADCVVTGYRGRRKILLHTAIKPMATGRDPSSYTYEQLKRTVTFRLDDIVPGLGGS